MRFFEEKKYLYFLLLVSINGLVLVHNSMAQCSSIPGGLGGSGSYCIGAQVSVGIPETVPGQEYTWYLNSKPVKKLPGAGDGGAVSFNFAASGDMSGNYVVKATKPGCNPTTFGNVTVTIDPSGVLAQTLTGGPDCSGNGVPLIMGSSQIGVSYQLYVRYDFSDFDQYAGITLNGTGGALDFGLGYGDGIYLVYAFGLNCSGAICASSEVYSHAKIPYTQGFNTTTISEFPMCWNQGDLVVGTSPIQFNTNSTSPNTTPFEGNRYVFWNSAAFPAGNETRLLLPYVNSRGERVIDIEFYWYNNNNTSLNATQNSNEGVQLQVYNNGWLNIGPFIPRHDGSLPPGTGQWKKKTITIPDMPLVNVAFALKFRSEHGNNCSLDGLTVKATPSCVNPSGLDVLTYGPNSVTVGWSAIPGSTGFQYAVNLSSTPPASGTTTASNSANVGGLSPGTQYYLHVRTQCAPGFSNWTTSSFYTLTDCSNATVINLCTAFNVDITAGRGVWDFDGTYPKNSTGEPTIGKEKFFRFTPPTTGVYYLENISGSYVHALYKTANYGGCIDSGWIGMLPNRAKSPFGLLQGGTEYLIVFDGKFTTGLSASFRVCRANVAVPSITNNCIDILYDLPIAANSTKEEYILDQDGNLIASLNLSEVNDDLQNFQASYQVRTGSVRRDLTNKEYLDRNFSYSHNYLYYSYPIKIKLFFTNSDLQKLIDEPNDGIADVNAIDDLSISAIGDFGYCDIAANGSYAFIPQVSNGVYDVNSSYVEISYILGGGYSNSAFYINGGNLALNYQCPSLPAEYLWMPLEQGFNPSNSTQIPGCWTETQSGSQVSFQKNSINPITSPFEGTRFIFYNSYGFQPGTSTILTAPPFKTTGSANVDVEFYWYNNNNPIYPYADEGVRVEYSLDGSNWTLVSFVQRHDGSLPAGTGDWKKKRFTLPANAGNKPALYVRLIFISQYGDNCALDAFRISETPPCGAVQQINVSSVTGTSVSFNWPAVPGVTSFLYGITNSATPPSFGNFTTSTSVVQDFLSPTTKYYLHVRPECSAGVYGAWISKIVYTTPDCSNAPVISACTDVVAAIPEGTGAWNFLGYYPNNSVGFNTPGKETIYKFTPASTGVYYLQLMSSTSGYIDYFYKPSSSGCTNSNWIGIDDIALTGKYPIGMLQAGVEYFILLDAETTIGISQTFRICKAGIAPPVVANTCIPLTMPENSIPANSTKEEFILDDAGNLIASLNFSQVNNDVGYAYASYYANSNAVRRDNKNKEYLDRNLVLTTDVAPQGHVKVKFYFTNADLQRLINEPNDGNADVNGIADLNVTRSQQYCSSAASEVGASLLTQTSNGSYDASSSFIEFITTGFSSFYLHGGFTPLFQVPDSATLCPGVNSTLAIAPVGAGYTYQWQVNTGSGFENINDNSNYSGTNTTTLQLINPSSSWYGYKFRCVATNGGSTIIGVVKTLKFSVSWNGISNSNWADPINWNCNVMPDENTDVIIPAGVLNMPTINTNSSCRSIRVSPGATLTITSGISLEVKGK